MLSVSYDRTNLSRWILRPASYVSSQLEEAMVPLRRGQQDVRL